MIYRPPSLIKIVFIDSFAYNCFILPLTVCIIGIYMMIRRVTVIVDPIVFVIPLALTLVSVGMLVGRIRKIHRLFEDGVEAQARLTHISRFYRGRGYISFEYIFRDQKYTGKTSVQAWKSVLDVRAGDRMIALVNPANPGQAILRDLFIIE